ncbi:MAG TPA: LptF/LptG family permease [Patescibacteria group bacterium]|nr:LptF/LptG family permease [Patescibacteria group bacterium]
MRILDRYILKSVVRILLLCVLSFLLLYVIVDVFANLDDFLKQKTNLALIIRYYLAYLPIIFVQVAPISCLLSVLYTFGKLNRDNELIAMRASGLSIFQIAKSVMVLGAIVSILVFWVGDRFVPRSLFMTQKIKAYMEVGSKKAQEKENETITNLSIYGLKNRLFFVNKFSPSLNTLEGISILEHDKNQNIVKKIVANKGVYKDGLWTFYQSVTYEFDENGQVKGEPKYLDEEIVSIPESPQDFLGQKQSPDFMTIAQLDFYIQKLSGSGATGVIRNLTVDLFQRFSAPLTSFIIILIGIPFSLVMRKRATGLSSLGVAIMVGFLYYVVNAISIALGKSGILPALLAVTLSHIMALAASLYLISALP